MKKSKAIDRCLDVEEIVLKLLQRIVDTGTVAVSHLRPAGDARSNRMALPIERDLLRQLGNELGAFRPWTNKGHVTQKHVPQLRQFVESASAGAIGQQALRGDRLPSTRPLQCPSPRPPASNETCEW